MGGIVVRTQIQLSEVQFKALKELSTSQNISMAELIRQAVDVLLRSTNEINHEERKRRAIAAAGRFHSGLTDLSTNHDRYLAEAYAE